MSSDPESKLIHDSGVEIVDRLIELADERDICPHCLGVELIYMISKEIAANMEVDTGELFGAVHMGLGDGEEERGEEGGERPPSWTLH